MQLDDPLYFYAVTDHAAWLGMIRAYADPNSKPGQLDFASDLHGLNDPENLNTNTFARRAGLFGNLITGELIEPSKNPFKLLVAYLQADTIYGTMAYDRYTHQTAWRDIAEAADRHNKPRQLTTFIAYEFTTSLPGQSNLHRNVIFKGSKAPIQPFSIVDSRNPEDLWNTMDKWRKKGIDSLAIPHNSNGSNGRMFEMHKSNLGTQASIQAVKTDGTLWSWGYNGQGVLGINLSNGQNRSCLLYTSPSPRDS